MNISEDYTDYGFDEEDDDNDYIEQLAAQISILSVNLPRDFIAEGK